MVAPQATMADKQPVEVPRAMSRETFSRFSEFVTTHLGIKMSDVKMTMLQSRLQKRLRSLNMVSYEAYYDYVFSPAGRENELSHMIDAVTTNKTDFFREPKHFEYLVQSVLPNWLATRKTPSQKMLRCWSAGCSTGAEPYTLAMVLSEFAAVHPGVQYTILGSDISRRVLEEARIGIYEAQMVSPVPLPLRKKYLLRKKDPDGSVVRMVPELRAMVRFQRLNFMDENYGLRQFMDVIFCRNVLIYFDRPTQERVINRLCRHLATGGYLFVGHSETLNGLNVPLEQVNPTIYRRLEMAIDER